LKILNPKLELPSFFEHLREAEQRALILDYDGTLAPFHIRPEKAFPYPGVRDILDAICRSLSTRVVVVSGRYTEDLIPLLGLSQLPEIWGSHGLERLKTDGTYEVAALDNESLRGLEIAKEWIQKSNTAGRCEQKPGCLALHWRGMEKEKKKQTEKRVNSQWSSIAQEFGLQLKEFDGGLELRAPGRNKGDAVKTVLDDMAENTVAAYLGDDVTDEDAFRAMKGKGICILVRKEFRPTAAELWLRPPEELLRFLSDWLITIEGKNRFLKGKRLFPNRK